MTVKIVRSPRAPALDLGEALKKAQALLKIQGKQSVPSEIAAKHLGYSGKNNGAAARALGALKQFGLVDTNSKGDIAVSKDVETYQFNPNADQRRQLVLRWVTTPRVYADLLAKAGDMLPSDEMLRYQLIDMGFLPPAASESLKTFKASVDFARYFDHVGGKASAGSSAADDTSDADSSAAAEATEARVVGATAQPAAAVPSAPAPGFDRIPVRLSKGRRAWLELPTPFYEADKELLKRQIDLIFADEEEQIP